MRVVGHPSVGGCIGLPIILQSIERVSYCEYICIICTLRVVCHHVHEFILIHIFFSLLVSISVVVSISLSYIDRILSTNHCADRRTFKLISATSLHLAIKVHFPHMWREVGSLIPDLSRGDFALHDLVEMEKELTHSLTWLLNPATSQSIVMQMLALLPPTSGASTSSLNSIASTALFLAELSVCDYFFVTSRKSTIAIAAYLNASESAGYIPFESHHGAFEVPYQNDWHVHIERLLSEIGYVINWQEVSAARERLWSLYRQSSESSDSAPHEQGITCSSVSSPRNSSRNSSQGYLHDYPSPTSVGMRG